MPDAVLCLNAGSSSIKFALFTRHDDEDPSRIVSGHIAGIGNTPRLGATDAGGHQVARREWPAGTSHETLVENLLSWVAHHLGGDRLVAAGHRVVHGGNRFCDPVRIDPDILAALDALTPLAPLHQPHCLSPIRAILSLRPDLPQVACFDTAFHHSMPSAAQRLPLPAHLTEDGLRRYGFHGLSYEYIARTLRDTLPRSAISRVVIAHLGNGASLCALADGRSVDTTMGFTALDGLVMGTRCGDLDPGVLLYLLQEKHMSADEVSDLLYHRSGLLGVSGISGDMSELLSSTAPAAAEAIELFVFRIVRELAAMVSSLRGLDALIFTGGIGEHAAPIRAAVGERISWLGVELDPAANASHAHRISTPSSRVSVHVVPTDEELTIARHTIRALPVT